MDEPKKLRVVDIACPYCDAKPGEPCRWPDDMPPMFHYHLSRWVEHKIKEENKDGLYN